MECGLYSFLLSFSFIFLDLYLFLKYEGMRPVRSEMQKKAVELGVDIVVFPGLILTVSIARILSELYNSALPFALGMVVATFFATVISLRLKNQPERFVRLTGKIAKNSGKIVAFNLLVLSVFTFFFLKALCRDVEMGPLLSIMVPLVLYGLLSLRYSSIVKQTILWRT
uniref:Uncharacterized protein n=1 Tax=Thermococcus aciditolerans TaxID=2598455 RepID=A0A5C0SN71_9EURY|nr:hypothetical protein FPV09_04260 [Thermococcus aciditolerans]